MSQGHEQDPSLGDDAALKAAMRRVFGGETAPPALRNRISTALMVAASESASVAAAADVGAGEPQIAGRIGPRSSTRVWWKYAAAALFFLGAMGAVIYEVMNMYDVGRRPAVVVAALPPKLAAEMVQTHDAIVTSPNQTLIAPLPAGEISAIKQKLREQFGHPVLASSPGSDWAVSSAGMTKVGERPAALVLFTRGKEKLSMFSIPAPVNYPAPEGSVYQETLQGHAIAGVVAGGNIYCLIESTAGGQPNSAELQMIRDRLGNPTAEGGACTGPAGGV